MCTKAGGCELKSNGERERERWLWKEGSMGLLSTIICSSFLSCWGENAAGREHKGRACCRYRCRSRSAWLYEPLHLAQEELRLSETDTFLSFPLFLSLSVSLSLRLLRGQRSPQLGASGEKASCLVFCESLNPVFMVWRKRIIFTQYLEPRFRTRDHNKAVIKLL